MTDNDGPSSPHRARRAGAGEVDRYAPPVPKGRQEQENRSAEDQADTDPGEGPPAAVGLNNNEGMDSDDDASEANPAAATILPSRLICPISREPPTDPRQFCIPRTDPDGSELLQVFEFADIYTWIGRQGLASRHVRWDVGHPTEPSEKCPRFFAVRFFVGHLLKISTV